MSAPKFFNLGRGGHMKICYKNLLYGAVLGVMLEMILILADAVDEFIID